ncbi:NUDIX domain-containing protein [Oceaniglobus ichthyenteri]|uniref:NUDIX domain-containing protein n=1 Tax=Oceaniglobus ichthyenteri TaxID=2136177 RepID=UPI000D3538AF|nr:NUDIX domain-containing protein [Oceaniglobus ichthyenteri]
MTDLFVFGTLRDSELRQLVAGCDLHGEPGELPGHGVWRAETGDYPVLGPGEGAVGLLLRDIPEDALARLSFYQQGVDHITDTVEVTVNGARQSAMVYLPATLVQPADEAWDLAKWTARRGAMTRRAATEAMTYFGKMSGAQLRTRMNTIRYRAEASLRAVATKPHLSWHDPSLDRRDINVVRAATPYVNYFAVGEYDLTHTRFDGSTSGQMNRGGFLMGDAVTVLPYDPVRDRVLLVEQFRFGIFLRGDPVPWSLEPVAGRIDPGETPDQAARRETEEEAGLTLHRLIKLAGHYPSPAAVTEYLYSFIGLCDLPDLTQGEGGLDTEHEDIRTHIMGFDDLLALADRGEIENTPLLFSIFWLFRERGRPTPFA